MDRASVVCVCESDVFCFSKNNNNIKLNKFGVDLLPLVEIDFYFSL